jgi:peptide/nickel transport system substrate-binding protein
MTTTSERHRRTSRVLAATAVAVALAATACGSSSTPTSSKGTKSTGDTATPSTVASGVTNIAPPTTTVEPPNLQRGGTLTYVDASDPATLDPNLMTTSAPTDGVIGSALYDNLMYFNSKDGKITPSTALSLTSSDGLVWTLKLRSGITFTDGTPYDAAAVKFNWERIADPANKSQLGTYVAGIQSMDVVDATTLKITLKSKSGVFPNNVATPISWIGSPSAIQKGADQFGNNPVGAGPFMFKSWVRGSQLTLVRNPKYWNSVLPYLDQVEIKPIQNETQRVNTLNTDAAQMLWTRVPDTKGKAEAAGKVANTLVTNGGTNAYFNTATAPFKDQRVREAVVRAIDRAQYAKIVNNGATPPIDSIFAETSPFYDKSLTQYPYDRQRAQELFNQVAADTGGPVTFEISGFAVQTQQTQAEYLQGILNQFKNVKATVKTYAIGAGVTKLNSRDYQMMLAGNYFIDPEPAFTSRYVCDAKPSYTAWCDPKFDSLVHDEITTLDASKRIADIKDAQKIFYAAAPSLYYDRGYSWEITSPRVQNFDYANDGWVLLAGMWLKS